ncbi:MAG: hypothetical protein ACOYNC_07980 [Bacteroidales bacterium]
MRRIIIILMLLSPVYATLVAQTQSDDPKLMKVFDKGMTISKFLAQKDEDFWKSAKALMYQNQGFEDGHGMYAWSPALKQFPKRVGLLSFMVFDPGFFEQSGRTYGNLTISRTESGYLSASGTKELADGLYSMSIEALKKDFGNYGATLLTPEEFANTAALREIYHTFDFREKGLAKMMSSESSANTLAVPGNYMTYYAENLTMPAYMDAITAKIKALGLDAAMIIKIQMGVDGNGTISVQSVSTALYGPNPVPKNPDKKYIAINPATGYHEGNVYSAVKMGAFDTDNMLETKEGLNIIVFAKNKSGARSDFSDFDKLLAKICGGNNYTLNMWITGGWKPFKYK